MYYVIEAIWTNGNFYGYVTGMEGIDPNPDMARKFTLPADAECWLESHQRLVDNWLSRSLVMLYVARLAVAEEPEPILA